jgi:hypothetical protein
MLSKERHQTATGPLWFDADEPSGMKLNQNAS